MKNQLVVILVALLVLEFVSSEKAFFYEKNGKGVCYYKRYGAKSVKIIFKKTKNHDIKFLSPKPRNHSQQEHRRLINLLNQCLTANKRLSKKLAYDNYKSQLRFMAEQRAFDRMMAAEQRAAELREKAIEAEIEASLLAPSKYSKLRLYRYRYPTGPAALTGFNQGMFW